MPSGVVVSTAFKISCEFPFPHFFCEHFVSRTLILSQESCCHRGHSKRERETRGEGLDWKKYKLIRTEFEVGKEIAAAHWGALRVCFQNLASNMAVITTVLDFVLPPTMAFLLLLLYPALTFVRFLKFLVSLLVFEDVRGKVILITGASSGIGEHLTYQYAKRGARLVIVARRENLLERVADRAMTKGATDVHVIAGDVTKQEECKRFVDETINKYGRLDHLVNNAGIAHSFFFEQAKDTSAMHPIMDVTFWGHVYSTYYALPHLRRSKGKILEIASVVSVIPYPRQSIYNSAKAAALQFYETLRVEVGETIGITIVMPGWIESEMTRGKFVGAEGELTEKPVHQRDAHVGPAPVEYAETCARAAVLGVLRSHRYVVVPYFYYAFILLRVYAPEILETLFRIFYVHHPIEQKPLSKVLLDTTKAQQVLYPQSIQKQE